MLRSTKTTFLVALGLAFAVSTIAAPLSGASSAMGPGPAKAVTIPLYGSATTPTGWGWTANNISNSLTLTVGQGDVLTFDLYSNDSMTHELIIDLDNSHTNSTGDAYSPLFLSKTTATPWTYTASTAGTFAFFCGIHGYNVQHGTLVVSAAGGGGGTTPASNSVLIIGGVVIVIAIVAVAAAIMMRRKKPQP